MNNEKDKGQKPKTPPPRNPRLGKVYQPDTPIENPVPPGGTALQTVVKEDQSMNKLLQLAIGKLEGEGAESVVTVIKELVNLKVENEQRNAEKEFNNALAEFQNECPPIKKASVANVATKSGSNYSYAYAELDEIARTVKDYLFHRGLSFNWDSETADKTIKVTCYLRHRNGHKISSSFQAPIPDSLGSMNAIQINGAVLTYIKRQSLVEILGLTTTESDTDGISPETLDEKEIKILKGKAERLGANATRFLEYMDVEKFEDIRKVDLSKAALALDMYSKKEPTEKTDKPEKKKKPEPEPPPATPPAETDLNKIREKAYALLKTVSDKKLVNRDKWEPIIKDAKSVENLNTIMSNLTAFLDEAGTDGKLEL